MKQNKHHFFLGVFVLTAFALVAAVVTLLGAKSLWQDYLYMETYINESVSGLERGSPVKFRGIPIGKVDELTTVAQVYDTAYSYAYIKVKIYANSIPAPTIGESVGQSLDERVNRGLRVALASAGVTGGSYLEIEYVAKPKGSPELVRDWDPRELYIPSVPSTLFRFTDSLDTVLANLAQTDLPGLVAAGRDTLRSVDTSLSDLDFKGLSAKAQGFLDRAGKAAELAAQDIDKLSTELQATLRELRDKFGATLGTADATLAKVNGLLDDSELVTSLGRLANLLDSADQAVQEIRGLTGRANRTVLGIDQIVRGRSRDVATAIGDLREILQNINALTGMLGEYPSLLFVGKAPKDANISGGK